MTQRHRNCFEVLMYLRQEILCIEIYECVSSWVLCVPPPLQTKLLENVNYVMMQIKEKKEDFQSLETENQTLLSALLPSKIQFICLPSSFIKVVKLTLYFLPGLYFKRTFCSFDATYPPVWWFNSSRYHDASPGFGAKLKVFI